MAVLPKRRLSTITGLNESFADASFDSLFLADERLDEQEVIRGMSSRDTLYTAKYQPLDNQIFTVRIFILSVLYANKYKSQINK